MDKLPIDVVPGTHPKQFRWRKLGQQCQGALPTSVEDAVAELVALAKRQQAELGAMEKRIEALTEAQLQVKDEPTVKPKGGKK